MARKDTTLTRGEKILFTLVFLFVVLIGAATWWWDAVNKTPVVQIPTPAMPNPNALDYYVQAANSIVDRRFESADDPFKVLSATERQAVLTKNARALQLMRQGLSYECAATPMRSYSQPFPEYARLRELARLLRYEALVKTSQGDMAGAVHARIDAVRLGVDSCQGGGLLANLVGIAIQAIARAPENNGKGWDVARNIDAATARNAARQMEQLLQDQTRWVDVLREEKWAGQAGLLDLFRQAKWRQEGVGYLTDTPLHKADTVLLYVTPKSTIMGNYTAYMDALIARANDPYAVQKSMPPVPVPGDPLSAGLAPVFGKARFKHTYNETSNVLLTLTFALQAYHEEHGAYPAKLADLAPEYLTAIPADPFAKQGPPQYRRTGKSYVLYSVGPDSKDDGGKPVDRGTGKGFERYGTLEGSQGDMVVGVNTF